jgi:hypothetical protein
MVQVCDLHHNQTGGRRIQIRARIGLRSGKMGNRSPYKARIGFGLIPENEVSKRGFTGDFAEGRWGICLEIMENATEKILKFFCPENFGENPEKV